MNEKSSPSHRATPSSDPEAERAARLLSQGLDPTGGAPVPVDVETLQRALPHLQILELVGQGGMGAVFKARQPRLDRTVAVKVLAPALAADPAFAERFEREAKALARLDHPHVVRVHDFGEARGLYYLVLEFVEGVSLRQLLEAGRLSPEEALRIVPSLCEALQYAHDHGVVHRDVKPENVLIDEQGRVKIADFGLAKMVGRESGEARLTGTHQAMGTWQYMAPEQVRAPRSVDHRADIYSLGVVFYEMLTGELPVGRFQPPSAVGGLDDRLDAIVLRALERERELRYQQARDVEQDVVHVTTTGRESGPPGPVGAAGAGLAIRWGVVLPALLLVTGMLAAGLTSFFVRKGLDQTVEDARNAMGVVGSIFFGAGCLLALLAALRSWGRVRTPGQRAVAFVLALANACLLLGTWIVGGMQVDAWRESRWHAWEARRLAYESGPAWGRDLRDRFTGGAPLPVVAGAADEDARRGLVEDVVAAFHTWAGRLKTGPLDGPMVRDLYALTDEEERIVGASSTGERALGLPLVSTSDLPAPAHEMYVARIQVSPVPGLATATAVPRDERRGGYVRFPLRLGASGWGFAVGPVEIERAP